MEHEIELIRSPSGWDAQTKIFLKDTKKGKRYLVFITGLGKLGIESGAYCCHLKEEKKRRVFDLMLEDFYEPLISYTPAVEAKKGLVIKQHKEALLHLDQIIEQANAYYQ